MNKLSVNTKRPVMKNYQGHIHDLSLDKSLIILGGGEGDIIFSLKITAFASL